jgi:hypothetical protein
MNCTVTVFTGSGVILVICNIYGHKITAFLEVYACLHTKAPHLSKLHCEGSKVSYSPCCQQYISNYIVQFSA